MPEIDLQSEKIPKVSDDFLSEIFSLDLQEISENIDPNFFLNEDELPCDDMELASNEEGELFDEATIKLILSSFENTAESDVSIISEKDIQACFESLTDLGKIFSEDQEMTFLPESKFSEIEAVLNKHDDFFDEAKFQGLADTPLSSGVTPRVAYTANKKQTFFGSYSTEETISEKRIKAINEFLESSEFSQYKFESISLTSNSQILDAIDIWWLKETQVINTNTLKKQTNGETLEKFLRARPRQRNNLLTKNQAFYINSAIDLINGIKSLDDHNYCSRVSLPFSCK